MMRHRKLKIMIGGAILLTVFLVAASAVAAPAAAEAQAGQASKAINQSWQLTNAKIVNSGQTAVTKEGTLITGFTVEATATTTDPAASFQTGKFQLALTMFSPSKDLPGQKAGRWYVYGDWSITDPNASPEMLEAKHSPAVIKGKVSADLSFNPAAVRRAFTAKKKVSMALMGGQWLKGQVTVSFNTKFEGTLSIVGKTLRSQP